MEDRWFFDKSQRHTRLPGVGGTMRHVCFFAAGVDAEPTIFAGMPDSRNIKQGGCAFGEDNMFVQNALL